MNPTARFLDVVAALQHAGFEALVMDGHAVRYYGVDRNTLDFDFHVSIQTAGELETRLLRTGLFAKGIVEGPSWRRDDFRRFRIGTPPDGREEWLEFWIRNHLLEPFPQLWARREEAVFQEATTNFLSLPDLIHSKETERESDWQDVALLEEILDLRRLAQANDDAGKLAVVSGLRSRRGFERIMTAGFAADATLVRRALVTANCNSGIIAAVRTRRTSECARRPKRLGFTGGAVASGCTRLCQARGFGRGRPPIAQTSRDGR